MPFAARTLSDARTAAAAREWATRFQAMRWRAVTEGRHVGFFFEPAGNEWSWREVVDGNGNGLRTAEVRSGMDRSLTEPRLLSTQHQAVRLALPTAFAVKRIPPRSGWISGGDPVRFGAANLISFAPSGRSSSGTLFLTDDRNRVFGIRLFGASARVRVWRWDRKEQRWRR